MEAVRRRLGQALTSGHALEELTWLHAQDSLETNVLARGLAAAEQGPDAVEELIRAALSRERQRYERSLTVLAIVGCNAPSVGLFGTVLGIIHAFRELASSTAGSSAAVMSGVSEALVATAVGLLVAIPAVSAFNFFKAKVRTRVEGADQLVRPVGRAQVRRSRFARPSESGCVSAMHDPFADSDEVSASINVTPFVDVVLVLLVIFMVTSDFMCQQSRKHRSR